METNNVKLTDNEIIKAWELEATPMERNCLHARYEEACGMWCEKKHKWAENCMECKEHTMGYYGRYAKATLDLINRQKAEIENYKQIAENQQSVSMDKEVEIKRLRAEVESLNKEIDRLLDTRITTRSAEKQVQSAKAEAVKEFAERLKEYELVNLNGDGYVLVKCIIKLLKEMGVEGE